MRNQDTAGGSGVTGGIKRKRRQEELQLSLKKGSK